MLDNAVLEKYFPQGEVPGHIVNGRLRVYFQPKRGARSRPGEIPWPPEYRVITLEEEAKQKALLGYISHPVGSLLVRVLDTTPNYYVYVHDDLIEWPKQPKKAKKQLVKLEKGKKAVVVNDFGEVAGATVAVEPPKPKPAKKDRLEWLTAHPQEVTALRQFFKAKKVKAKENESGFVWLDVHGDWVLIPTGTDKAELTNKATNMTREVSPVNTYRIGQAYKQVWGFKG